MIDGVPLDDFRVECLRPVDNESGTHWTTKPFYELYGESWWLPGVIKVIRYEEHMLPLARAIRGEGKSRKRTRCFT